MAAHSEDFVIPTCIILTQYCSVMDGWTDASTIAMTRLALRAVARKNRKSVWFWF